VLVTYDGSSSCLICAPQALRIGSKIAEDIFGRTTRRISRLQKFLLTTCVVLILLLSSSAQNAQPVLPPEDVVLQFETEGDVHNFHMGELIPVQLSYSAKASGKYIRVSQAQKLAGGQPIQVSCPPSAERVSQTPTSNDKVTFDEMLAAPCGHGGGIGGGCADGDGESPLTESPVTFGEVPLNTYVRFRTPGTYICEASSADITTSPRGEKNRVALLVKSNALRLTITNDPDWARSAALEYADLYGKLCRGDDVVEHRFVQCSDVARRLTYLDTLDSLAAEVKMFDGQARGWENGFWDAIQDSWYPDEALRLMAARIQEPDFAVSTGVLEWVASSELRMEVPDAFQTGPAETYHAQAIEKLRKYVRLLGSSLPQKQSNVVAESMKTYGTLAARQYCQPQSLIPGKEQKQVLAGLNIAR
jgi:hypothetical protein